MEKPVSIIIKEGTIRTNNSSFSSVVLLVRKKWHVPIFVDYHPLNAIKIHDRFPIHTIDDIFDELNGGRHFPKLDLLSGYNQIRVGPKYVPMTTFHTLDGHYKFLVMPFCLTNTPYTFEATMT